MKKKDYVIIAGIALMICAAIVVYAFKSNSDGIIIQTAAVSISEETEIDADDPSRSYGRGNSTAKSKTTSDDKLASRNAASDAKAQSRLAASMARLESQAALVFDINAVSKEELMLIDGVSESLADLIIETRVKNGGYAEIMELRKLKDVSEQQYYILKEHLYIDPATARVDVPVKW